MGANMLNSTLLVELKRSDRLLFGQIDNILHPDWILKIIYKPYEIIFFVKVFIKECCLVGYNM